MDNKNLETFIDKTLASLTSIATTMKRDTDTQKKKLMSFKEFLKTHKF